MHIAQLWYRNESPKSSAQSMQARKGAYYVPAGVPQTVVFLSGEKGQHPV